MTDSGASPGPDGSRASARVVLVDDSSEYRSLLAIVLGQDTRFEVVAEAADGAEGLVAVVDHRPDLVVTDLQMPKIDGIEFTRRLRRTDAAIPIVMVTGLPGDDVAERAYRAGVTAFLPKTGGATRLIDTLHAALDKRCPGSATG